MPYDPRFEEYLKKANDEFRRTGTVSIELVKKLQTALAEDTEEVNKNTKAQEKFEDKSVAYTKTMTNLAKQIGSNLQAMRKNRESFTGLSGAVKTGIQAAGVAATSTTKTVGTIAGVIGDIAWSSKHPIALIAGGIAKGAEWFANKTADAAEIAAKVAPVLADFALKEIQDVVDSYQKVGSVGMTTAQGMTGLRESANQAGLSLKTYAGIVSRNGQALAAVGGSTEAGAAALDKITQATESTRAEYLKLGFTFEEQEELAIKGMDYRRRMGLSKTNDMRLLGESTKNYYNLVDDIARMTGMSRSQAASILEKQQSNKRFALKQLAITEQHGGDTKVADTMSSVSAALSVHAGEDVAQAFQDATAGVGPESATAFEILTDGKGQPIIDRMLRGELTKEQTIKEIHAAVKAASEGRGGIKFAARVGGMAIVSDQMLLGADRFARATDDTIQTLGDTENSQENAKNATDGLTNNVVDAQFALRDFARGLDELVARDVLPRAATITNLFTTKLRDFISKGSETFGLGKATEIPTVPGAGGGSPPPPPKAVEGKPDLVRITTPGGKSAEVNKDAAPAFQKLVNWLEEKAGYKIYSFGGFADRDVRGKPGVKSVHAMGGAIDINPDKNPLGGSLITDMPENISQVAKSLGLGWGGNWTSRKDAMHFSAATREGGSIMKFAEGGIASGPKGGYDVMMHGTEAVVPLPNGTDVPVSGGIISDRFKEQTALFEEQGRMIDQMIMAVKNTNDANQRILAMKSS